MRLDRKTVGRVLGRSASRAVKAGAWSRDRIRHARHPLHGVAKWSLIAFQALIGLVVLFALTNLALSLTAFRDDDPARRLAHEITALWHSPVDGEPVSEAGFETLYGDILGPAPEAEAIRAHLSAEVADGEFLLDHVLTDHILRRFGGLDSRTCRSGSMSESMPWGRMGCRSCR